MTSFVFRKQSIMKNDALRVYSLLHTAQGADPFIEI